MLTGGLVSAPSIKLGARDAASAEVGVWALLMVEEPEMQGMQKIV